MPTELVDAKSGATGAPKTKRARIYAVSIEKGGTGKTTSVATLGHALADRGRRVLLVDVDPQHNLTKFVGHKDWEPSLAAVLRATAFERGGPVSAVIREAITDSRAGGAKIINSSRESGPIQDEIKTRENKYNTKFRVRPYAVLRDALAEVAADFDYIFLDCPRTLDLMSTSALVAATDVLVPVDSQPMAVDGLGQIRETIQDLVDAELVEKRPDIRVLFTKYDGRQTVQRDMLEFVRGLEGVDVYKTIIRNNVKLIESYPTGLTVLDHAPGSPGAVDYRALAEELDAHG